MGFIRRQWTPKEADEWRKEDWIALCSLLHSARNRQCTFIPAFANRIYCVRDRDYHHAFNVLGHRPKIKDDLRRV
jgi:hypothetical protein